MPSKKQQLPNRAFTLTTVGQYIFLSTAELPKEKISAEARKGNFSPETLPVCPCF